MVRIRIDCLPRHFELALESLTNNPNVADIIVFMIISSDFLFDIDKVCCVYSLESPR